jgi:hypothetical protein
MSTGGVEFEEDSFNSGTFSSTPGQNSSSNGFSQPGYPGGYNESNQSGLAGWLIRHRLAKTPQGAQKVMIGIAIFNFTVAIFALYHYL